MNLPHDEDLVRANVWDLALLRRLVRYLRPYWRRVAAGVLLASLASGLFIMPPLLAGALVDSVFEVGDGLPARAVGNLVRSAGGPDLGALPAQSRLVVFAVLFLVIRLVTFFVDWGNGYLLAVLGQQVIYDIRMQVFHHIHRLDLAWFHRQPVGRLVTRTANDVGALEELFSVALVTIIKDVAMLAGISGVLLLVDLRLGLVALAIVPPMLVATVIFRKYSRAAYRRWRAALSRLNAFLAETLSGVRVVKLFHREAHNDRVYDSIGKEYQRHFMSQRQAWAVFRPVNTTLMAFGTGLVLAFGGGKVLSGAVSVGELLSFLGCVELFFAPIRDLTEKIDILQGAMTAGERIFGVLDERAAIVDPPDALAPERLEGAVEFCEVDFGYVPGEPVLRRVSFAVAPGENVAIVGHTGAGKTTVINLLSRFYDVGGGRVLVDGRDVREYRLSSLRGGVAIVHQDVFLFAGTVLENLRLSDPGIPPERVREACRRVAADDFIERMPGAYDAIVEEGGKTLSSGERQLLSFARALVFDPAILVLDEATSSVDSKTEERIQAALSELTAGRTSIVIAHRLSTIRRADRILVFDRGRLVESGTHEALLSGGGTYRRLHDLQFAG